MHMIEISNYYQYERLLFMIRNTVHTIVSWSFMMMELHFPAQNLGRESEAKTMLIHLMQAGKHTLSFL